MSKKLEGKVALVTGASKGIGASIATHLANEGAKVIVNYSSSKTEADKVVNDIKAKGGQAVALQANVARESDIRRLFADSKKAFGTIDILVNNAGIYEFLPLEDITVEHYQKQFDLNVLGLILASQEAVKQFGPNGGNIINVSSVASTSPLATAAVYSGTKAAVDAITKSLSKELGAKKIRVNSVNPGMIVSEGVKAQGLDTSDFGAQIKTSTPLGRLGLPDDVAKVVTFLVSDDAGWITGEALHISGGHH